MIQKILRRFMSLALSAVLVVTLLPVISRWENRANTQFPSA